MGRVARYKKTKSFDRKTNKRPGGSGEYIWGETNTLGLGDHRRAHKKKRSQTAEKLHQQKLNRRRRGPATADAPTAATPPAFDGGGRGEFDAAPCEHDDFDLADLNYTVKRQKRHNVHEELRTAGAVTTGSSSALSSNSAPPSTKPTPKITHDRVKIGKHTLSCTIPQTDADERRTARLLNLNPRTSGGGSSGGKHTKDRSSSAGGESVAASTKLEGRKEGESITKFNKRLREETKMALLQDRMKARKPEVQQPVDGAEVAMSKAQRRKEYLTNRKRKKKGGSSVAAMMRASNDDDDGYDSDKDTGKRSSNGEDNIDSFITGERASFLDQAERPPVFQQLPRGAVVAKKSKMAMTGGENNDGMDERRIRKEQNAMEAMRNKVVAQYALVKARRRMEREGHS